MIKNENKNMNSLCLEEFIAPKFVEPTFHVNFHKIGRPIKNENLTNSIQKTNDLFCWKIKNEQLFEIKKENVGILFDSESYIVQWLFDLKIDGNQIIKEMLVFYWKGQHAVKGYTPIPPDLGEMCPVDRIVQWSEPAIFFYSLQNKIVFSGKEDNFEIYGPHLLLARGELRDEIHFYEVPCKRVSLRSRTSFLLIVPERQCFLYWHGSQTSMEQRQKVVNLCKPHNYLKKWQNCWSNFLIQEQEEGQETSLFLDMVQKDPSEFVPLYIKTNVSPKLFYLNAITGTFIPTIVEYPLRAQNELAAFPFLQSHLYTALQPALFLLDDNSQLWLWEGIKTADCNINAFEEELKLAKAFRNLYLQEKQKLTAERVTCFHVQAHKEPQEFKNLFPLWVDN